MAETSVTAEPSVMAEPRGLGEEQAPDAERALVTIRAAGSKPPLFCVHASAGHLRLMHGLASHLDPDRPVFGLQGVLGEGPERLPYRRLEDMAERYVREMSQLGLAGPYLILGECNGGKLALELAQQLRDGGADVPLLVIVDSLGPGVVRDGGRAHRAIHHARMLGFHARALARIDPPARRQYVTSRLGRVVAATRARLSRHRAAESPELVRRRAYGEALAVYRAQSYSGRVALFRGARLPSGVNAPRHLGWAQVVDEIEVIEIPGYFGTTMMEPTLGLLAEKLAQVMDAAVPPVPRDDPARASLQHLDASGLST